MRYAAPCMRSFRDTKDLHFGLGLFALIASDIMIEIAALDAESAAVLAGIRRLL